MAHGMFTRIGSQVARVFGLRSLLLITLNVKAYHEDYLSLKYLPGKMKWRVVIIKCTGYIFWQLFLQLHNFNSNNHLTQSDSPD